MSAKEELLATVFQQIEEITDAEWASTSKPELERLLGLVSKAVCYLKEIHDER